MWPWVMVTARMGQHGLFLISLLDIWQLWKVKVTFVLIE